MKLLKFTTLSVILIFILCIKGFSQFNCHKTNWISPVPTSNTLNGVFFTDANTGYVTGVKGTILKTTDGGTTWKTLNAGTSYDINAIWFTSADTGYAGGEVNSEGIISKTTDGGKTWKELISGRTPGPVRSLYFISKDTGFAGCGFGKFHITTDAGKTWKSLYVPDAESGSFENLQFTADRKIFMTTDSKIFKSTDMGKTWTNTIMTGFVIDAMNFPTKDVGYVAGGLSPTLYKTTNGGVTWNKRTTSGVYGNITKAYFSSVDTGYIATSDNNIFKTVNGGLIWKLLPGNPLGSINAFYFVNNNLGYAAGERGNIFRITESGVVKLSKGFTNTFYEIDFTSDQTGYICGSNGTILQTKDRAKTWNALTTGATETLYCITFPDALTGYAAGSNGIVLKTVNGGTSWTKFATGGGVTFAMSFVNSQIGYIAGGGGFIRKTTDGGKKWISLSSGIGSQINDMFFIDADTGYVAASGGFILKTKDQGVTWTKLNTGTTYFIGKIIFINPLKGYAFGEDGIFLTTEDAGQTWTKNYVGWGDHIRDAAIYDQEHAYFATGQFNGSVYSSFNGTKSWQAASILNDGLLNNLYMLSKDSVLVTGPSGLIVMVSRGNPVKPTITTSENILTSSDADRYQWYKDGVILSEETSKTYVATSPGKYSVKVSDENGCSSLSEEVFADVIITDLALSKKNNVLIFPNPVENFCTVQIKQQLSSNSNIEISDITGRMIDPKDLDMKLSEDALEINTSQIPAGVYMIRISSEEKEYYGKFLKY